MVGRRRLFAALKPTALQTEAHLSQLPQSLPKLDCDLAYGLFKSSDRSCMALGAVGRKTRRAGRFANSLDLYAPVLSRGVRMPSMENFHEPSAADSDALGVVAHPRRGSKPARKP
jgi:hypothetical protein